MNGVNRLTGIGVYPNYNFKINNYGQKSASSPIQTTASPKKNSKTKAFGLAAGITVALAAGAAILLTKGKAIRNQKLLAEIPKDLQARFSGIKNLEGKKFIDNAYKEMVDYMGLNKVAPKTIAINAKDKAFSITGGYNPMKNTIGFSEGFLTKLSKEQQLNMMAHELKHCEQFTNMLRTEGITVEQYVAAGVDSMIKEKLGPNSLEILLIQSYENAVKAGKGEEWLAKVKQEAIVSRAKTVRENFADILALPKFKADSPLGKRAYEQLKAYSNYEGIDFFGTAGKAYKNNPLEVEAYAFGGNMKKMFEDYITATK